MRRRYFSKQKGYKMSNTLYANTDSHLVASGGGLLTVAVGAAATEQANSGTSLPCKVVYVNGLGTKAINCAINVSTNVSTAVMIPSRTAVSDVDGRCLEIPIDDVSKLWFYSSAAASVNITYRY
jgi:hypothetical protein